MMAHGPFRDVIPCALMGVIHGLALQNASDARILIPFLGIACIDRLFSSRYECLPYGTQRLQLIVLKFVIWVCMIASNVYEPLQYTTHPFEFQCLFLFAMICRFLTDR